MAYKNLSEIEIESLKLCLNSLEQVNKVVNSFYKRHKANISPSDANTFDLVENGTSTAFNAITTILEWDKPKEKPEFDYNNFDVNEIVVKELKINDIDFFEKIREVIFSFRGNYYTYSYNYLRSFSFVMITKEDNGKIEYNTRDSTGTKLGIYLEFLIRKKNIDWSMAKSID